VLIYWRKRVYHTQLDGMTCSLFRWSSYSKVARYPARNGTASNRQVICRLRILPVVFVKHDELVAVKGRRFSEQARVTNSRKAAWARVKARGSLS